MDEADIFAEIQRESDLVRSLVRKLSESISCRNLGEATDIFQKLIEREPRKPYALHVVVVKNASLVQLCYYIVCPVSSDSPTIWPSI